MSIVGAQVQNADRFSRAASVKDCERRMLDRWQALCAAERDLLNMSSRNTRRLAELVSSLRYLNASRKRAIARQDWGDA